MLQWREYWLHGLVWFARFAVSLLSNGSRVTVATIGEDLIVCIMLVMTDYHVNNLEGNINLTVQEHRVINNNFVLFQRMNATSLSWQKRSLMLSEYMDGHSFCTLTGFVVSLSTNVSRVVVVATRRDLNWL